MSTPPLPDGWSYEYAERDGQPHTRARGPHGRSTFWMVSSDQARPPTWPPPRQQLGSPTRSTPAFSARTHPLVRSGRSSRGQADMFADLAPAQLADDRRTLCPKHGRFYQPHCWHCKRRRSDRPHKRARQG